MGDLSHDLNLPHYFWLTKVIYVLPHQVGLELMSCRTRNTNELRKGGKFCSLGTKNLNRLGNNKGTEEHGDTRAATWDYKTTGRGRQRTKYTEDNERMGSNLTQQGRKQN